MELRRYLAILRRRILLILLAVVLAVGFTAITSSNTPTYTAKSTIYVGASSFLGSSGTGTDVNLSGDQNAGLSQLIRTFATMIDSEVIAEDAIGLTGVSRSAGGVVAETEVEQVPGTNILEIRVTDADPAMAQTLSTGLAEAFVAKISKLEPGKQLGEGGVPSAPAQIFERAGLPTVPKTSSLASSLVIAALLGLAVSAGLVLLGEYLDITVKSASDAEMRLELPVLAAIPILTLGPLRATRSRRPIDPSSGLELVRDG